MNKPFRRFTDKPDLDPMAVMSLPPSHPAMVENRTLFPTTVVEVTADAPDRLLVSGANNRKLGDKVAKGRFKGYALYGLSLEERATCPLDCSMRSTCYGSSMQMARRHRIGDPDIFFDRLGMEIVTLIDEHEGLLVRLHVLGDFPSVEYVAFWADALNENEKLAVYGYTHRKTTAWGGDEIGDAIEALKDAHPDRFRIRWSSDVSRPDGAVVINYVPDRPRIDEGLVCPAQTEATACCASCGLCWEPGAKHDTIVFIRHGRATGEAAAEHERAKIGATEKPVETRHISTKSDEKHPISAPPAENVQNVQLPATRAIQPIDLPANIKPNRVMTTAPETRLVSPTSLRVEAAYQRELSAKSIKLIRKIVDHWQWAKFKPPVVAETEDGLFIIDGQHTAIAAATHTDIREIPVLVVGADRLEKRADAFVSHNRDRLAMSPFQVFHAEAAAKNPEAMEVLRIVEECGGTVPRSPPARGYGKPGQFLAVGELRKIYRTHGAELLVRILRIAVRSEIAPIPRSAVRGLRLILTERYFARVRALSDEVLAKALGSITNIDNASRIFASSSEQGADRAAAMLIAEAAGISIVGAAA